MEEPPAHCLHQQPCIPFSTCTASPPPRAVAVRKMSLRTAFMDSTMLTENMAGPHGAIPSSTRHACFSSHRK